MSGGRRGGFVIPMSGKGWRVRCLRLVLILLVSCRDIFVFFSPFFAFLARYKNRRETNADDLVVRSRVVRCRSQIVLGEEHLPPGDLQSGADFTETFRREYSISIQKCYKGKSSMLTGNSYHQFEILGQEQGEGYQVQNRWFVPQHGFKVRLRKRL